MRIPRLYIDQELHVGADIILAQDKTHHVANVLRMRAGDKVKLFNGNDSECLSTLKELNKKNAVINVEECVSVNKESNLKIILGLGISRGQHMDYSIQKSVELGVNEIVPVLTEFSNVKIQDSRKENKLSHWRSIIINATEQCGRTQITKLSAPLTYREYLEKIKSKTCFIFHPGDNKALEKVKIEDNEVTILVGPEGGFSEDEINMAKDKNYIEVCMGPRVLRAETAVVTALSICQYRWGDLS